MFAPGARSMPACTERVSVATPPSLPFATVWISDAPCWIWIVALNEPSTPTVAATLFTVTVSTGLLLMLGRTVPCTVMLPVAVWTRLRCGEVTLRIGGSFGGVGPSLPQAVARRVRPVTVRRLRMAGFPLSKVKASPEDRLHHRPFWELEVDRRQRNAAKTGAAQLEQPGLGYPR